MNKQFCIASSLLFLITLARPVPAQTWTKQLSDGVTLTQTVKRPSSNATPTEVINAITIDPKTPGVRLKAALGGGTVFGPGKLKGRESISSAAKRINAVAAVNAGFFYQSGDPLGLHISDGELMSEPWPNRVAFGITGDGRTVFDQLNFDGQLVLSDGRSFPIRGINRLRGLNELVAFAPVFQSNTCNATPGTDVIVNCDGVLPKAGKPIPGTVTAIRTSTCESMIPSGSLVLSGSGAAAIFMQQSLRAGDQVRIELNLRSATGTDWSNVQEAVGGGPWLVRDGKTYIDAKAEGIKPDIYAGRNARTSVGVTADGRIVIATVGGWRRESGGMTLTQLATLMKSLGCVDAINLDGGGSTTLANSLGVLNQPSDDSERSVAEALAVCVDRATGLSTPSREDILLAQSRYTELSSRGAYSGDSLNMVTSSGKIAIVPPAGGFISGNPVRLMLADSSTGQILTDSIASKAVWSITGGIGFIDQSGLFHPVKAKKGGIGVIINGESTTLPVEVLGGDPTRITARVLPDESGAPNRGTVSIKLTDRYGSPVPARTVAVSVTGGTPDQSEAATDTKGQALIGITWDNEPGISADSVVVETVGLSSKRVKR